MIRILWILADMQSVSPLVCSLELVVPKPLSDGASHLLILMLFYPSPKLEDCKCQPSPVWEGTGKEMAEEAP